MPTPPDLPKPVWNLLAVFFAAWGVASAWLLLGGDTSAVVRFAFALCGAAMLFTGSVGGLFRAVGLGLGRRFDWLAGKKLGCWAGALVVVAPLATVLFPMFQVGESKATSSSVRSTLIQEVIALTAYAQAHDGIMPPDMSERYRAVSLLPYQGSRYEDYHDRRADRGRPFVWCKQLAGLRLSDIAEPDKVVVAYSSTPVFGVHADGFTVVYLDSHAKAARTRQDILERLRERPALLAHAVRAKAKRYAAVKPPMKKALP